MSAAIPLLTSLEPRLPETPPGGQGVAGPDRFPVALEAELSREPEAAPEPGPDSSAEPAASVAPPVEGVEAEAGRGEAARSGEEPETPQGVEMPLSVEVAAAPLRPPQAGSDPEAAEFAANRLQAHAAARLPLPLEQRAPASPADSRQGDPQVAVIEVESGRPQTASLPQSPVPAEPVAGLERVERAEPVQRAERSEPVQRLERAEAVQRAESAEPVQRAAGAERDRVASSGGGRVTPPAQPAARPEPRERAAAETTASPPAGAERAQRTGPDAPLRGSDARADSPIAALAGAAPPAGATGRPRGESDARGRDPGTPDRLAEARGGRRAQAGRGSAPESFRAGLINSPGAEAPTEPSGIAAGSALAAPALQQGVAAPPAVTATSHAAPEAIPVHAEWLAARGGGVARLSLHPPELGGLQLHVRVRGNSVEIVIVAEESAARAIAHDYRDQLVQNLASRDLRMDHFEVRSASGDEGGPGRDAAGGDARAAGGGDRGADGSRDGPDTERGASSALAGPGQSDNQSQSQPIASADAVDLRI